MWVFHNNKKLYFYLKKLWRVWELQIYRKWRSKTCETHVLDMRNYMQNNGSLKCFRLYYLQLVYSTFFHTMYNFDQKSEQNLYITENTRLYIHIMSGIYFAIKNWNLWIEMSLGMSSLKQPFASSENYL